MISIGRLFTLPGNSDGDEYCHVRFRCRTCKQRKSAIMIAIVALEVAGGIDCYACAPEAWLLAAEIIAAEYTTRPLQKVLITNLSGGV